ncbi:MAG: hypothetical protein LBU72_03295 [Burkholderiaceae bacterium]|jgi:hypothetical protein|nr:hypothetical protein [Burkholderiaceae bacterium]
MKKSILTLGALAVVGGLGLAGSAQAVYFFGQGIDSTTTTVPKTAGNTATALELNPGSTGHALIVPYYTVQGTANTLIDIVNTDLTNGKAVKVRFRGAANSDDVLDFTVMMSPGDVWTANISEGANGAAQLTSGDKSCTLPGGPYTNVPFITNRLPGYMSADQKAANTREGYIEILNMADIPPLTADGSTNFLYNAIKHVNGAAPCSAVWTPTATPTGTIVSHSLTDTKDALQVLLDTTTVSASDLSNQYGLESPTGLLTGGWAIVNQTDKEAYSADDVAVRASLTQASSITPGSTGSAYVAFSPQIAGNYGGVINLASADPLLTGGSVPPYGPTPFEAAVPAQWYDVPDLSSPLGVRVNGTTSGAVVATPTGEADILANALAKTAINDEFVADPNGTTGAPMTTDWILSQPTRRYFAVIDYNGGKNPAQSQGSDAYIVYNLNAGYTGSTLVNGNSPNSPYGSGIAMQGHIGAAWAVTGATTDTSALPYAGVNGGNGTGTGTAAVGGAHNLSLVQGATGPLACWTGTPAIYDREETTAGVQAQFSPGFSSPSFCGEAAVLSWGGSPLNAGLTDTTVSGAYTSGWANFVLDLGTLNGVTAGATYGLPVIGFAAINGINGPQGYGITWPLRW